MKNIKYYLTKLHILLSEDYAKTPRKFNCCDKLVEPRNIEQHIKDYHKM